MLNEALKNQYTNDNPTKTFFNLPKKIIYCKKFLMSNQRPNMCPEHYNTHEQKKNIRQSKVSG